MNWNIILYQKNKNTLHKEVRSEHKFLSCFPFHLEALPEHYDYSYCQLTQLVKWVLGMQTQVFKLTKTLLVEAPPQHWKQ